MYNNNIPIRYPVLSGGTAANPARREDPLIIDIQGMFNTMVPALTTKCCIYRVPWRLRKLNEAAYTPCSISFGPFHHGKPEFEFMEKHKERYLFDFLQHAQLSLDELVNNVRDWGPRVRLSYAETINLTDRELTKMLLLDGCFIIEYVLRSCNCSLKDENDKVLYKPWLDYYIVRDLILLENQLPFFVLQLLYDLAFVNRPSAKQSSFVELVSKFLTYFNKQGFKVLPQTNVLHFTDLVRTFHLTSKPPEPNLRRQEIKNFSSSTTMPPEPNLRRREIKQFSNSATMLDAAGVQFKGTSSNCLFDIRFTPRNGELELPHLDIEDRTNSLMRNLMALEQCHYPLKTMICDYIILMDTLINTTDDVDLLVRKGVLTNSLGSHDVVATLFNSLGREISHYREKSYFCKLTDDLDEFYEKPWNSWKASLKREYLNTPWRIASIVAATILLVLTAMQTLSSYLALESSHK